MKAIQITEPNKIEIIECPRPIPKDGEALLKVLYCGICGADIASYTGTQPFTTYPRIPGHEFSAEVVSVGENDRGIKVGDTVTCNPYFNCGECYACKRGIVNACVDNKTMGVQRDGGFAEYITMPVSRIIDGRGISAKELALIEPFAISCHALSRADIPRGSRVLIMGAGPIGLFALMRAKALGLRVMIADMLESRLRLAGEYGADRTVNVKKENLSYAATEFTERCGFDACIEACGTPETFLTCINEATHGANIILIGNGKRETTFLHSIILKKELNIFGSRNALTKDFEELIELVKTGSINVLSLVSRVYPFERVKDAFDSLKNNDGTIAKILLEL